MNTIFVITTFLGAIVLWWGTTFFYHPPCKKVKEDKKKKPYPYTIRVKIRRLHGVAMPPGDEPPPKDLKVRPLK